MINKINVDGVDHEIISESAEKKIAEIDKKIKGLGSNTTSTGLTKITYAELKALRDNGQLSEGHLYRITDYVTTTTQAKTKSAGNVFDVIVLATSTNELSHIARAIQHEGDTYFDGNDLGAWELWYDLDNDTEKYEWADATNGKGVIYRMIDEKRNDCPYDFKNILFYNNKYTNYTITDKYYYTFSYVVSDKLYDGTVEKQVISCYDNSMGVRFRNKKRSLNKNVFRNNYFLNNCYSNTFGNNCDSNTFEYNCYSNTFGDSCQSTTFGYSCHFNTFAKDCYSNTFGDDCNYNTFGNNCNHNIFGNNCYFNTFGNGCSSNTLNNYCNYRRFDNNKTFITLNDEYYDDGSGQLVPIKHPDLSTQPSILPYKFMGQYVYEQLIPIKRTLEELDNATIEINADEFDGTTIFSNPNNGVIEASFILFARYNTSEGYPKPPTMHYSCVGLSTMEQYGITQRIIVKNPPRLDPTRASLIGAWLRIVYTSMPEEGGGGGGGGGYYGYNEYGGG